MPSYECPPFADPAQQHVAEEDGPDPVVDFFKTDTVLLEGGRQVQQPSLEANGARVGDALREEVAWILERRQMRNCFTALMPANQRMEPSRTTVYAITSLRRAAHSRALDALQVQTWFMSMRISVEFKAPS